MTAPTPASAQAVQVLVNSALLSYTGRAQLDLALDELAAVAGAPTLRLLALMDALDRRHPGLKFRVVDEQQRLRPHIRVFVNGQGTRDLAHPLAGGDTVGLLLALSGG